jgi:hypothetical protein
VAGGPSVGCLRQGAGDLGCKSLLNQGILSSLVHRLQGLQKQGRFIVTLLLIIEELGRNHVFLVNRCVGHSVKALVQVESRIRLRLLFVFNFKLSHHSKVQRKLLRGCRLCQHLRTGRCLHRIGLIKVHLEVVLLCHHLFFSVY